MAANIAKLPELLRKPSAHYTINSLPCGASCASLIRLTAIGFA
jgi:hypothetical protein